MKVTIHYSPRNVAGALDHMACEATFRQHQARLLRDGLTVAQWLKQRVIEVFNEAADDHTLAQMTGTGSLQIVYRGLGIVYVPVDSSNEPSFNFQTPALNEPSRYSVAFYSYSTGTTGQELSEWSISTEAELEPIPILS